MKKTTYFCFKCKNVFTVEFKHRFLKTSCLFDKYYRKCKVCGKRSWVLEVK